MKPLDQKAFELKIAEPCCQYAKFTNEDGMTAFVFQVGAEKFNVSLRDDDSGEYANMHFVNFSNVEDAIAKAKSII
jgi:hypothetical protein